MRFTRSARFYDAVYAARGKDYAAEAQQLRRWLPDRPAGRGLALLDLGCGTGEHLRHLADGAALAVGVDVDTGMLREARGKLPRAHLIRGDMTQLPLRRRFDAVLCLFAALGYLPDRSAVRAAVAGIAARLAPRGVLLAEPPLGPERLRPSQRSRLSLDCSGVRVTRVTDALREPDRLRVRFEYRVDTPSGTETFVEEHPILALPLSDCIALMESAGLEVEHDESWPSGPGLLVGRRPGGE